MKTFTPLLFCLLIFLSERSAAQYQFIAPLPGSQDHNPDRCIVIREGSVIKESSLKKNNLFEINGSKSGSHDFETVLCDDRKTILLKPEIPFTEGETVNITIHDGVARELGGNLESKSFSFGIHPPRSAEDIERINKVREEVWEEEFGKHNTPPADDGPEYLGIPPFYITTNTNPSPGEIFFHNYNFMGVPTGHHCIITVDGDSVYGRGGDDRGWDFKLNHNGYITMFYKLGSIWEMYDSSYNKVKTFKMANGYLTDMHDFQIFPDGHYYLQGYEYQVKDLSIYDSTYSDHATVAGLILQGFDASKNIIFEWRSWDHIDIFEAPHATFTSSTIDYVHGNSIEEDTDGNIIISCRHLDQVNKINVSTGEFMWRLGGEKNEFTFVDDPEPFTYQHDARRLPNGNITLFDNGNYHTVPCSYAREYKLDEVNKVAKLVWFYKHPKFKGADVIGWALGNVQRLDNGNTFINWGYVYAGTGFPNLTEVTPDGEIVWEMRLLNTYGDAMYRAHKYEWDPCARPTGYKMKVKDLTYFSAELNWSPATGATQYNVQYREVGNTNWWTLNTSGYITHKKLNQLWDETTYEWRIQTVCANGDSSAYSLIKQFTTLPLRLESGAEKKHLIVYPNPAQDLVTVEVPDESFGSGRIQLMNLLGEKIAEWSFDSAEGQQIKIPLQTLSGGIYSIELRAGEEVWMEKLVVQ